MPERKTAVIYILDMGYKGYRTGCDVPYLVTEAIKNGVNFIPI